MPEENQKTNQQSTNQQTRVGTRDIKRHTAYRLFIGMINQGKADFHGERFLHVLAQNKEVARVNIIANIIDKFVSEQKPYCALTIDDGTGTIRVKAFADSLDSVKNLEQGDTINVIGRLSYYNDEIYILPEIAKESSITWLIARKLELEKEFGKDILKKLSEQDVQQQMQKQSQPSPQQIQEEKQKKNEEGLGIEKESIEEEKIDKVEEKEGNEEEKTNNKNGDNEENKIKEEILNQIKGSEPEGIDIDKVIMSMNKPVDEINNTITGLLESGDIYEPKPGRLRIL